MDRQELERLGRFLRAFNRFIVGTLIFGIVEAVLVPLIYAVVVLFKG